MNDSRLHVMIACGGPDLELAHRLKVELESQHISVEINGQSLRSLSGPLIIKYIQRLAFKDLTIVLDTTPSRYLGHPVEVFQSVLRAESSGTERLKAVSIRRNENGLFEVSWQNELGTQEFSSSSLMISRLTQETGRIAHDLGRVDVLDRELLEKLLVRSALNFFPTKFAEPASADSAKVKPLSIGLDPGKSTSDDIADLMNALSDLNRTLGGFGVVFKDDDVRVVRFEETKA